MCLRHVANHCSSSLPFRCACPVAKGLSPSNEVAPSRLTFSMRCSRGGLEEAVDKASMSTPSSAFVFCTQDFNSARMDAWSCGAYKEETSSSAVTRIADERPGNRSKVAFDG